MPIFDTKKYFNRFLELAEEGVPSNKKPLESFQKSATLSLEATMVYIKPILPHIDILVRECKERAIAKHSDRLNDDQKAAIFLYTAQWKSDTGSVYYQLNRALRNDDKTFLKPWYPYLTLFLGALALLPPTRGSVFRGIKMDSAKAYEEGQVFIWCGFTSCTNNLGVLNNEAFFGQTGARTLFTINCHNGRDIKDYSYFEAEDEILLPAMQQFRVKAVVPQPNNSTMIQLEETNEKSLLELVAEEDRQPERPQLTAPPPIIRQPGYESGSGGRVGVSSNRSVGRRGLNCCAWVFCCPCMLGRKVLKGR